MFPPSSIDIPGVPQSMTEEIPHSSKWSFPEEKAVPGCESDCDSQCKVRSVEGIAAVWVFKGGGGCAPDACIFQEF